MIYSFLYRYYLCTKTEVSPRAQTTVYYTVVWTPSNVCFIFLVNLLITVL